MLQMVRWYNPAQMYSPSPKNNYPHNEIQVIYLIQLHLENPCLSLFFLV